MPTTIRLLRAAALVWFATLSGAALAQSPIPDVPAEFDFDRLEVNSDANGSIVVGTGEMLPAGTVRFSVAGEYQNNPLMLLNIATGNPLGAIVSDRYTAHVLGAFAPMDWMEIGVDLPVILGQIGADLTEFGVGKPLPKGIGSPTGSLRLGLLSQKKGAIVDMALHVGVRAPIGTDGAWASDGRINLSPKLMMGRDLGFARAGVEVGAKWLPASALNPVGAGNQLLIAGVIAAGDPKGLRGEVSGRTYMTFDGTLGAVELLVGARYPIGLMEVYAVAGPGLGDREASPGTPAWRVLTGVSFGNGLGVVGATGDVTNPTPTTIPSTPMPVAASGGDSGSATSVSSSPPTSTPADTSGTYTMPGTGTGFTIPVSTGSTGTTIVIPSTGGAATGGTTPYPYPTTPSTGGTYTPPSPTPTTPPTDTTQQQPSTYGGTNPIGPGMGGIQSWPTGMGTTSQPVPTDPNQQGTTNP